MEECILTKPLRGQFYPSYILPKGRVEEIEFAKSKLEELAIEYDLSKPTVTLDHTEGPQKSQLFYMKIIIEERRYGNKFMAIGDGKPTKKLSLHSAARKILLKLQEVYFFSEEENVYDTQEITYVYCLNCPLKILRLKLYKWENSCQLCFARGHVRTYCHNQIRNKRFLS